MFPKMVPRVRQKLTIYLVLCLKLPGTMSTVVWQTIAVPMVFAISLNLWKIKFAACCNHYRQTPRIMNRNALLIRKLLPFQFWPCHHLMPRYRHRKPLVQLPSLEGAEVDAVELWGAQFWWTWGRQQCHRIPFGQGTKAIQPPNFMLNCCVIQEERAKTRQSEDLWTQVNFWDQSSPKQSKIKTGNIWAEAVSDSFPPQSLSLHPSLHSFIN